MIATPASLALLALLGMFYLHVLWRLIADRDACATACFAAAYLILASTLKLSQPPFLLAPILLPFIYCYAWLGVAAVLWSACFMRAGRRELGFPGRSPKLAALFASQLALHIGVLGLSPWLDWRPLAIYVMAPPLVVVVSYPAYRLLLYVARRRGDSAFPWTIWGGLCLLMPLALLLLERWLAPLILPLT